MAVSVDRNHQQYPKENVVDFEFDVVEESKELQNLSLTDMPPQPQVPKKEVDDGGKQLDRGNFCYTDLSEWFIPYTYSPCLAYSNSLPKHVLILDETPEGIPITYSPLYPSLFESS